MTKFVWVRDGKTLRAVYRAQGAGDYSNPGLEKRSWITEDDMLAVAKWCIDTGCGRRISYDMFKFKRREDITAFLLRWS